MFVDIYFTVQYPWQVTGKVNIYKHRAFWTTFWKWLNEASVTVSVNLHMFSLRYFIQVLNVGKRVYFVVK